MNAAGGSIVALIALQYLIYIFVYYIFAVAAGRHIVLPGLTPDDIIRFIGQLKTKNPAAMPASLLAATVLADGIPFVLCAKYAGINLRSLFARPAVSAGETALFGVVALGASFLASLFVTMISLILKIAGLKLTTPALTVPKSLTGALLMIFAAVFAAPLMEEFICRGVLLNIFRRYGDIFAVVASSLVWALLHGNLVQGIPVFAMGLLLGRLALKAGSIVPTLVLHAINNALSLLESSFIKNPVASLFIGMLNFSMLALSIVFFSVYYQKFGGLKKGGGRGFAAFFSSVPVLIAIIFCAVMTVFSVKPV